MKAGDGEGKTDSQTQGGGGREAWGAEDRPGMRG